MVLGVIPSTIFGHKKTTRRSHGSREALEMYSVFVTPNVYNKNVIKNKLVGPYNVKIEYRHKKGHIQSGIVNII